jgi:colanic acid biosynthesis glycosyl transferase WcaI
VTDSRPRVIFVNRVYWPSTEATAQLLTDLAEGLVSRGWSVHVIAAGNGQTIRNGVTIHRTGDGEHHTGMISRALNYRRFESVARARLDQLARPGDTVVAMTDPPLLAVSLNPIAAKRGLRLILWLQDIYPEIATTHFGPLTGWLLAPWRAKRDAAWRNAATCVTLGKDMAASITHRGIPQDKIEIIPNWAPRELHDPVSTEARQEHRQAWGVDSKFVVTYSGNLGRVHEFDTVMAAARILRDQPDIVILLIGRGARLEAVVRSAQNQGLRNVQLLPPEPRERLARSLTAADAHLVTLRPEYASLVYPSKLAGVLAAGRPVLFVGPSSGDIVSLIRDTNCGANFAPGDGIGLADAINHWQATPTHVRNMGAAARSAYEQSFTFDAALTRWNALLHRLNQPN